jgi:hypothetical protein
MGRLIFRYINFGTIDFLSFLQYSFQALHFIDIYIEADAESTLPRIIHIIASRKNFRYIRGRVSK